ncbi:hypothetical protein Tco_1071979 [Tanacetum coccineum]
MGWLRNGSSRTCGGRDRFNPSSLGSRTRGGVSIIGADGLVHDGQCIGFMGWVTDFISLDECWTSVKTKQAKHRDQFEDQALQPWPLQKARNEGEEEHADHEISRLCTRYLASLYICRRVGKSWRLHGCHLRAVIPRSSTTPKGSCSSHLKLVVRTFSVNESSIKSDGFRSLDDGEAVEYVIENGYDDGTKAVVLV